MEHTVPLPISSPTIPIEVGYWKDIRTPTSTTSIPMVSSTSSSPYPLPSEFIDEEWWLNYSNRKGTTLTNTVTIEVKDSETFRIESIYSLPELCIYYLQSRFMESYELAPSYCRFDACTEWNLPERYQYLGCSTFTDGVYIWPEGYPHYLLIHHIRPPPDLIQHILIIYHKYYQQYFQKLLDNNKLTTIIIPHYKDILPNLNLVQYDFGTKELGLLPIETYKYLLTHSTTNVSTTLSEVTDFFTTANKTKQIELLQIGQEFLQNSQSHHHQQQNV